jgi:hypothetical protein
MKFLLLTLAFPCLSLAGEKHIVKLLHFPNITPSEQKRLLMSDNEGSGSDDEQEQNEEAPQQHKTQRKKSSTKRTLDLQRKISQSKLKEERKESKQQRSPSPQRNSTNNNTNNTNNNNNSSSNNNHVSTQNHSQPINIPSVSIKHSKNRLARNGKISGGYEQFSKSLLTVPMPKDYCDPSSDDLSSEWDSDSMNDTNNKTNGTANKESKVRDLLFTLCAEN